jgi:hypothetical protein
MYGGQQSNSKPRIETLVSLGHRSPRNFLLLNPSLEFRHVFAQLLRFSGVPTMSSLSVQLAVTVYRHQHLMD